MFAVVAVRHWRCCRVIRAIEIPDFFFAWRVVDMDVRRFFREADVVGQFLVNTRWELAEVNG